MNSHFCKVGRVRPSLGEVLGLKELERKYLSFIEEAYNVMQTDAGLSDILYHEASKLKKHILIVNRVQE
jgi:hypothetical protein